MCFHVSFFIFFVCLLLSIILELPHKTQPCVHNRSPVNVAVCQMALRWPECPLYTVTASCVHCSLTSGLCLSVIRVYRTNILASYVLVHAALFGRGSLSISPSSASPSKLLIFWKGCGSGLYICKVTLSVLLCTDYVPSIWRQAGSAARHAHQHPVRHQGPAAVKALPGAISGHHLRLRLSRNVQTGTIQTLMTHALTVVLINTDQINYVDGITL